MSINTDVKRLQAQSAKLYNLLIDIKIATPYDAEYTDVWNTLDKLQDDAIRFDNALYNMSQSWKDEEV